MKLNNVRIETGDSEKVIRGYVTLMDYHLVLLKNAMDSNDMERMEQEKELLSDLRQRLVELEYFDIGSNKPLGGVVS